MIDDAQIKGLEKLVNSDIIKNIYPIIDKIEVYNTYLPFDYIDNTIHLDIYLNNPEVNKSNLWDKFKFDEYYLIDHHIRNLLPYIGIDNNKTSLRFSVYDTNFDKIVSNDF
jgi:hypothetical protein